MDSGRSEPKRGARRAGRWSAPPFHGRLDRFARSLGLRSIRSTGVGSAWIILALLSLSSLASAESGGGAPNSGRPVLHLDLGATLQAHFVASDLDSLSDLDRRNRRDQFLLLTADAKIGEHAYAGFRLTEDYSSQTPYRPAKGWADDFPSSFRRAFTNATARNDRAVLGYRWSWGDLRFGREDRQWGVGRHGELFISTNPFPMDGASLRVDSRHLTFLSLFAQLRRGGRNMPVDSLTAADPRSDRDAWLSAHRLEWRPRPTFRLGLYEAVAYGGRGIDLAYANPVTLLAAVTQDLDNRAKVDDKKVLGFDLTAERRPVTLYGEFLINRLVALDSATKGDSSQISGYAQLAGLRWNDVGGWRGSDFGVEYAHLDPEVYFHHDGDPGRALLHQGELIGHWLGPNADGFFADFGLPPHARLGEVRLGYEQLRWGVIDGRRGVDLGFAGLVRAEKRWITGRKELERVYAVTWSRRNLPARFGMNLDGEVRVARVERAGRSREDGWQAELRLRWHGRIALAEPLEP